MGPAITATWNPTATTTITSPKGPLTVRTLCPAVGQQTLPSFSAPVIVTVTLVDPETPGATCYDVGPIQICVLVTVSIPSVTIDGSFSNQTTLPNGRTTPQPTVVTVAGLRFPITPEGEIGCADQGAIEARPPVGKLAITLTFDGDCEPNGVVTGGKKPVPFTIPLPLF